MAKTKAADKVKVETRSIGKNLITVEEMRLFHRFVRKSGLEEQITEYVK